MESITVNDEELTYDIDGPTTAPALLLLPGWCQDHRLFDALRTALVRNHQVIRLNWRGHTNPHHPSADFGVTEQAADVIGALDRLGIEQVVPVSTSHGGWANIELSDRLGTERVPAIVVIDWIMSTAGPDFVANLQEIQDPQQWVAGRRRLFEHWQGTSTDPVIRGHLDNEMAAFGYDMWERSCRVIEDGYRTWGSPLQRMATMRATRPILHIYSQSPQSDYEAIQREFASKHPWFDFRTIEGRTHFPTLESPQTVAARIEEFLQTCLNVAQASGSAYPSQQSVARGN